MPTYEVEVNGQTYEIEAPDDGAVQLAVRQLQGAKPSGEHLTFEEGQARMERERLQGRYGEAGAFATGMTNGVPAVGPALLDGVQRAAAGIGSLINGEDYDANLERARNVTDVVGQENPIARTAGEVTGAVVGTAPLVSAAPAAFGIGGASLPARMMASGGSGAVLGGSDSAVRSGGDLVDTAVGTGLGAGLGLAGPFVGDVAGRAWRSVANRGAQNEAARAAGTSRPAVDVVARGLAADEAVGATNVNINAAGPAAMLADAGPSTRSILDTAIQRGGPQAGQASQRIATRAQGSADDISSALDQALGAPRGMVAPLEQLRTATQPARAAAYDAAYSAPIDYAAPQGRALEQIVRNRVPASIINRANNLMRVNGEESAQILANIAEDGTVTLERLPDVRQLDYITRALNDVARSGDGAGALGGNTAEGRAYGNLAREIRNGLGSIVPEYRTALNTAAEPIAQREATLFGQRILSPSVARDEVEGFMAGLSDAELNSVRMGVRSKIDETLANVKRAVSDGDIDARQGIIALRELSSDASRQKIGMLLSPQASDRLFRAVDTAARSFELRAGVATNSRTYARQAAERAVESATAPSAIENAASGRPLASAQGFLQGLMGTGPDAQLGRQDAAWGEIANLLTQPANQGGGTFLQAMQTAAQRIPTADREAARLADAVTRGVAISSAPTRRLTGR